MPAYQPYFWSPKSGALERELVSADPASDQVTADILDSIDDAGRRALGLIGYVPSARGVEMLHSGSAAVLPAGEGAKLNAALRHLRRATSLLDQAGERGAADAVHGLHDTLEARSGQAPNSRH